jgi:hypothetical protein
MQFKSTIWKAGFSKRTLNTFDNYDGQMDVVPPSDSNTKLTLLLLVDNIKAWHMPLQLKTSDAFAGGG